MHTKVCDTQTGSERLSSTGCWDATPILGVDISGIKKIYPVHIANALSSPDRYILGRASDINISRSALGAWSGMFVFTNHTAAREMQLRLAQSPCIGDFPQ